MSLYNGEILPPASDGPIILNPQQKEFLVAMRPGATLAVSLVERAGNELLAVAGKQDKELAAELE
jgi:hypothetical protein